VVRIARATRAPTSGITMSAKQKARDLGLRGEYRRRAVDQAVKVEVGLLDI